MAGTEYQHVELVGIGSDGLPITMSYRGHADGRIGVSTFKHLRASTDTQWSCVADGRPPQLRGDLS